MADRQFVRFDFPGQPDCLWRYRYGSGSVSVAPPVFEIEGKRVSACALLQAFGIPLLQRSGVTEYRWRGDVVAKPGLTLELRVRAAPGNPVVRFCYALYSCEPQRLTKASGKDNLTYLTTSFADFPLAKDVGFSEFNSLVHSYGLTERPIAASHFENGLGSIGPLLIGTGGERSILLAYEHGAQLPDSFLEWSFRADRNVALCATKGNYWHGRVIDDDHPYETLWMHLALVEGDESAVASVYRDFILHYQSDNAASRRPYIFYNTWNYQERVKWWQKRAYLADMNEERMLAEIDVAHRMGIDVFVIDTGWYQKTGDWCADLTRFPQGLAPIKERLDGYDMQLGLWFCPTVAAVSSHMAQDHDDCVQSRHGKRAQPQEIWETEASWSMCLVSRYADAFAAELIRLVRELGVTYFKWDGIGQYGCDDPGHAHGTPDNSDEERADCYAFEQVRAMARIVDTLCAACPEAIVDFDVTEGGRSVGLAFLSAGKYFLINNGPYSMTYNMPVPSDGNVNLFFWPGDARAWICRSPLTYDKWLPTVLFLTHYLPDDRYLKQGWGESVEAEDAANQWVSLASLVLGQNGIWGDLLRITPTGVDRFGKVLARYKEVREDITRATLRRTGTVAGSPEIYEKVDPATGRGVISAFAGVKGHYVYITEAQPTREVWHNDGVTITWDSAGRAVMELTFAEPGAKLIFFGVSSA